MCADPESNPPTGGAAAVTTRAVTKKGMTIPMAMTSEFEIPHPHVARLAIEVLYKWFSTHSKTSDEEVEADKALDIFHARLWREEMQAVAEKGITSHFLVIRPLNPLHMPGPEDSAEIAAAITALRRHGLIGRAWWDEDD